MNNTTRKIIESPIYQGADETITYTLTTTPWGSSPTAPVLTVKNDAGADVTSTVAPSGSTTATGDVITLKPISGLTAGTRYRMEIRFTLGVSVFETFADLIAQE